MKFVEGRQIIDAILLAAKTVEDYLSKTKKGYIIKPDFKKAYNKVDWAFLDAVMEQKVFNNRWRKSIQGRLTNTIFSIMINRRPRVPSFASRGLRQGDHYPLFSLYIIDAFQPIC